MCMCMLYLRILLYKFDAIRDKREARAMVKLFKKLAFI